MTVEYFQVKNTHMGLLVTLKLLIYSEPNELNRLFTADGNKALNPVRREGFTLEITAAQRFLSPPHYDFTSPGSQRQ